jgi:hypothetical protein
MQHMPHFQSHFPYSPFHFSITCIWEHKMGTPGVFK